MIDSFFRTGSCIYALGLLLILGCSGGDTTDSTSPLDPVGLDGSVGGDGTVMVTVTEDTRLEVRIYGVKPILPGEPRRFQAFIVSPDGMEMEVTSGASWSSL